jgi:hypothetical protein
MIELGLGVVLAPPPGPREEVMRRPLHDQYQMPEQVPDLGHT